MFILDTQNSISNQQLKWLNQKHRVQHMWQQCGACRLKVSTSNCRRLALGAWGAMRHRKGRGLGTMGPPLVWSTKLPLFCCCSVGCQAAPAFLGWSLSIPATGVCFNGAPSTIISMIYKRLSVGCQVCYEKLCSTDGNSSEKAMVSSWWFCLEKLLFSQISKTIYTQN